MTGALHESIIFDLINRIYRASCDPCEWSNFVANVQVALGPARVSLRLSLKERELSEYSYLAGFAPEYLETYFEHYACPALFKSFTVGQTYVLSEVRAKPEIGRQASPPQRLDTPGDLTCGAGLVVRRDQCGLLCVIIDIPERMEHLEPVAADLLCKLAPHLTRAFQLNESMNSAKLSHHALDGLMDRLDGAALLVTKGGCVLSLNREAEDLLRLGDMLRMKSGGCLAFTSSRNEEAYQAALATFSDPSADVSETCFVIASNERKFATVVPLKLSKDPPFLHPAAPVLLLIHSDRCLETPTQFLQTLFCLTKSEAEVALKTAKGYSPSEIAGALQRSKTTIRNQLAVAMRKMGVHRQSQVAALVASSIPRLKL